MADKKKLECTKIDWRLHVRVGVHRGFKREMFSMTKERTTDGKKMD